MSTLYLFGNGFDIAHGIATPYSAFRTFLAGHHESFLIQFEVMYSIQPLDDTEPWYTEEAQRKWDENVLKDLWQFFEEELGNPDVYGMHDFAESLIDGMPSEGVTDTLDAYWKREYGFSDSFQNYVLEWLKTIDTSTAICKKDDLKNNQSDLFINFNYTDTLEQVYGIEDVLHIHGGIPSCSIVPPIMGHGNTYIIDLYRRKAHEAQDEYVEWEESICNAIADFCCSLYKDTNKIINRNESFFTRIGDVEQIVCLGLSFGNVDIPYLERIMNEIEPTTKWMVYYYGNKSKRSLKEIFGILGITRKYEVYFLSSDHFWDR